MMKKNYPANLLHAMRLNEIMNTGFDYNKMTPDQQEGLNFLLSCLSERERIILKEYYKDGFSMKEITDRYAGITVNRVRQIVSKALKKMEQKSWLTYVAEGYEQWMNYQTLRVAYLEFLYQRITGFGELDDSICRLSFPARIVNALNRSDIKTMKHLILWYIAGQSTHRVRNIGAVAIEEIRTALIEKKLIPESIQPIILEHTPSNKDFEYYALLYLIAAWNKQAPSGQ